MKPEFRFLFLGVLYVLGAAACDYYTRSPEANTPPSPVAAAVAALAARCSAVDGTPQADAAVRRGDFNADSHDDFLLYAGWMVCENAASVFGDREKEVTVFIGNDAGGASAAFHDSVYEVVLEGEGKNGQVWLTVAGEQCGNPHAATFSEESFCDRALVWSKATARFDYAPLGTTRSLKQGQRLCGLRTGSSNHTSCSPPSPD